jgi:hypothetical protein
VPLVEHLEHRRGFEHALGVDGKERLDVRLPNVSARLKTRKSEQPAAI